MPSNYRDAISTVDTIYNTLADDIFAMRFPPGAKITEAALCARYNVSRNTLREAVALLLSHGLLVKVANKGIYVRTLDYADVQELFYLREILELEAIRSIMESGNIPLDLVQLAYNMHQNAANASWDAHMEADILFHSQLVESANRPRLTRLYSSIFAEVKLCIFLSRHSLPMDPNSSQHHLDILSAMENDDLETAQRLLSKHIRDAVENFRSVFQDNPPS